MRRLGRGPSREIIHEARKAADSCSLEAESLELKPQLSRGNWKSGSQLSLCCFETSALSSPTRLPFSGRLSKCGHGPRPQEGPKTLKISVNFSNFWPSRTSPEKSISIDHQPQRPISPRSLLTANSQDGTLLLLRNSNLSTILLTMFPVVREGPEPHEGAQDPEARPQHLRW